MVEFEATRNQTVSVGVTAVSVAEPRSRKVLYIRNISTGGQQITITQGNITPTSLGGGVVLKAGEQYVDAISEGYVPFDGQVTAISDLAGGSLSVFER